MDRIIAGMPKQALKTPRVIAGLLFAVLLFSNVHVSAGGRPVGYKRLFIIASTSYYFNDQFWDEDGNAQSYADNGKYSTLSLSLSAEYGLTRRMALSVSLPYSASFFNSATGSTTNASLGDASVGASYYLANIAYRTFFSVQGNLIFPVYVNSATQNHGYGNVGANIQFLAAGDFKINDKAFSFSGTLGASQYFGSLAPLQLSFSGSLGFSISRKDQISLSETTASSYSPAKAFDPTSPVPAKDFTYSEITVTVAHNISRRKSIFVSGTRFIVGKNTGIGNTISIGYAYKF